MLGSGIALASTLESCCCCWMLCAQCWTRQFGVLSGTANSLGGWPAGPSLLHYKNTRPCRRDGSAFRQEKRTKPCRTLILAAAFNISFLPTSIPVLPTRRQSSSVGFLKSHGVSFFLEFLAVAVSPVVVSDTRCAVT